MPKRKNLTLRHMGRKSTISLVASSGQVEGFVEALVRDQFFVRSRPSADKENWVLGRKIRLMVGDWPMEVSIDRQSDGQITISCFLFTPWGWIITMGILLLFFLPFFSVQGTPLVFLLGALVIGAAIYKRRLDLSPEAWWQEPPRQRWNAKMTRLIEEAFNGPSKPM